MKEDFLQFVWQYQYFEAQDLQTTEGDTVQILDKGKWNIDSGADFQYARVRLNGVEWVGTVEIHLQASDWQKHAHNQNLAYQNVILHVVWEADTPNFRADGTPLPTIAIGTRVFGKALQQYHHLLQSPQKIACASQWLDVKNLTKVQLLDKALLKRLERKSSILHQSWQNNAQDWEETAYQLLLRYWGMKINQEAFTRLAERLPLKIIAKQRDNITQVEALLLGQAGLLEKVENTDDYTQELQREYTFLAQKYQLKGTALSAVEWQFARLRPANLPTLRLGQLAGFLRLFPHLFSYFLHIEIEDLLKKPVVVTSNYWETHYTLGKPAKSKTPALGETAWQNILINVAVPLLACYSKYTQDEGYMDKAFTVLQFLPAEKNSILEMWEDVGLKVTTAFDSQALIEQYTLGCEAKKCLSCPVGTELLRR